MERQKSRASGYRHGQRYRRGHRLDVLDVELRLEDKNDVGRKRERQRTEVPPADVLDVELLSRCVVAACRPPIPPLGLCFLSFFFELRLDARDGQVPSDGLLDRDVNLAIMESWNDFVSPFGSP